MKSCAFLAVLFGLPLTSSPAAAQSKDGAAKPTDTAKPAVAVKPIDPAAAAEGRARLAAAIQAHGGEAFLKLKSCVLKGKGEVTPPGAGSALPLDSVTMSIAVPGRVRLDLQTPLGPVAAITPGNGGEPFMILQGVVQPPPTGFGMPDPMQLLRAAVEKNLPVAALPEPADGKPRTAPDGKPLQGFSVQIDDKRAAWLFLDLMSHLIRKIEVDSPAGAVAILLTDYKTVDKIPLPARLTLRQGDADFLSLTFAEIAVNVALADTLFDRPKP